MRVLALASQKGGSGKTTLSGHLAVQAQLSGAGPVCLIDIDPQGSLADWWNERDAEMPAFAQTINLASGVQTYAALTNTTVNLSNRCELRVTGSAAPPPSASTRA